MKRRQTCGVWADVDDVNEYMSTLVEMAKKAMKEQADFPGLFKGDTQVWDKKNGGRINTSGRTWTR
jgi:hypothetical protein